jgi:hypothetical protein
MGFESIDKFVIVEILEAGEGRLVAHDPDEREDLLDVPIESHHSFEHQAFEVLIQIRVHSANKLQILLVILHRKI